MVRRNVVARKMFDRKCCFAITLIHMVVVSINVNVSDGTIIDAPNTSGDEGCIMKLMLENFHRNSTVSIILSEHSDYGLSHMEANLIKNIFDELNCKMALYSAGLNHDIMSPFGVHRNFLIFSGGNSLSTTLRFLHSFYIWDSKAVFLVIASNFDDQKEILVNSHTTSAQSTPHVLVAQVLSNSTLQRLTELYISIPSKEFTRNKTHETLKRIGSCEIDGSYNSANLKLYSKIGKELRVGAIHAPPFLFVSEIEQKAFGSEVRLIKTIAEKLKMKINLKYYPNMDNLGSLYWSKARGIYGSGMVNDLLLNKIDIGVGNIALSDRATNNFAVSTPYTMDRLIWVLPLPKSITKYPIFPLVYDLHITLLLVAMYGIYPFLAYMATNYFRKTSNGERSRYHTFHGTFISFFAVSTGCTVDVYPKTTRMRFFLLIWVFYTYHLNMHFASTLIRFYAVDQYEPSMKTTDQLVGSDMQLGIDRRSLSYFSNYFEVHNLPTNISKNMTGKVIYCKSTGDCLSRIVHSQRFSMTLSNNYFSYAKHAYVDRNGNFLLATLPEVIVCVPIGIISKKGFVLQSKINVIILRINEAGLFKHWNDETIQLLRVSRVFAAEDDTKGIDASYALKSSDLTTVFRGIILELSVCGLVFLGELTAHRFKGPCLAYLSELIARRYNKYFTPKRSSNDNALFDYVN